jgi:hypothetical protein
MSRHRLVTLGAAAIVAVAAAATAPLRAGAVAMDTGAVSTGFNGAYSVHASCAAVVGAATSLSSVTYAINVSGTAAATNGAIPVAVGVTCVLQDSVTGTVYGKVAGGLPGPVGEGAGLVTVPISSSPISCVSANAVFNDGGSASAGPTCGVTPSAIDPQAATNTVVGTVNALHSKVSGVLCTIVRWITC